MKRCFEVSVAPGKSFLRWLGDAFASMGDAAFEMVRSNRVGRFTDSSPRLPLFSKFVRKLGQRHEASKRWLLEQAERHPGDIDLAKATQGLRTSERPAEDIQSAFDQYIRNKDDRNAFNTLRFSRDRKVFESISERLDDGQSEQQFRNMVALLEGFETRQRAQVVECVLRFWPLFIRYDLSLGVSILSRYSIHDPGLREEAVDALNQLLSGPLSETARNGIERLLA